MAEERLPLAELLAKAGDEDFLRAVAEAVVQMLMEADVEGLIGAARHERSGERTTYRNGYRDRAFDTRLGSLQLRIPKLRQGSYFPPFLEPRRTTERALVAVIQEAWIGGVSTRKVDDLVQAMGGGGQGSIGVADGIPPEGRRGSARARSASCAATSTSGSAPSSPARSPAPGRICGSTRRVCASARAGGWSRWRR
jgi:transposase-like protein